MKRLLIIIFLFASTLVQGQITFIGFDTTICSSSMSDTYTYSNWTSGTGGSFTGGFKVFRNGVQVYADQGSLSNFKSCIDMIFINDKVGFIVVSNNGSKLYKTNDYGQSFTNIGNSAPNYFGTYIVNENYAYLVTQFYFNNTDIVLVTKCSDIQPYSNLIYDDTINAPIYKNDTILNNSLCNIDSLKIYINNNSDTITYHINFTFLSTGIAIHDNNINIKLFPNPTSNQLNIEYGELQIERINILNIYGETIKTIMTSFDLVDVSNLTNGIYFFKIITKERTITKKFVKQ